MLLKVLTLPRRPPLLLPPLRLRPPVFRLKESVEGRLWRPAAPLPMSDAPLVGLSLSGSEALCHGSSPVNDTTGYILKLLPRKELKRCDDSSQSHFRKAGPMSNVANGKRLVDIRAVNTLEVTEIRGSGR